MKLHSLKQSWKAVPGYASIFLLLLIIEILIGTKAHGFVRSYGGDVLVLPLLYCLIRSFTGALPRSLPLCLFGLGCLAELLQWLRLNTLLGFAPDSLPAILIGSCADWKDIISYAVGTLLIAAGEAVRSSIIRHF